MRSALNLEDACSDFGSDNTEVVEGYRLNCIVVGLAIFGILDVVQSSDLNLVYSVTSLIGRSIHAP